MIIYPRSLITSEAAAATPLTYARIGYQTFTVDNSLDATDVTVSSEATSGPRDAPLRPNTDEYWEPTSLPATWKLDLGQAETFDYVGIVGRLGSVGASVLVETSDGTVGSPDNDLIWHTFASEQVPSDDAPMLFLDSSVFRRYVRITVNGSGSMPRLAVVYVGAVLKMPRAIYGGHGPITMQRQTVLYQGLSRGGQFLAQGYRRHGVTGSAMWKNLDASFVRNSFDPFIKSARKDPFFFAWRPADWPLEVAYAWAPSDIKPVNMGIAGYMQVTVPLQGVGHV